MSIARVKIDPDVNSALRALSQGVAVFTLAFVLSLFTSTATAASVQQSILCASYLDQRERAGGIVLPIVAHDFVEGVLQTFQVHVERTRAALPGIRPREYFANLFARLREPAVGAIVTDADHPAMDHAEMFRRRRVAEGLKELRDAVLISGDTTTPVRRLTHGRRNITEFLNAIKAQAYADQAALDEAYALRVDELEAEKAAVRAQRAEEFKALREKIGREGAESWRARVFGPSSDLSVTQRLAVLAGYAKKVFVVSLMSGVISPALIPITALTLGAGWWGVRQWLYLGADHAKVFVGGYLRERKVGRTLTRIEKYRAGVARADHQIADIDALIELVNRRDVPRAVASFTYDVHIPMDRRTPEFKEVLNGKILRDAARKTPRARRGLRIVRLHHVLAFDANGEPRLATNLIERTDLPRGARDWAATLVLGLFGG